MSFAHDIDTLREAYAVLERNGVRMKQVLEGGEYDQVLQGIGVAMNALSLQREEQRNKGSEPSESILAEAQRIIDGPRRESYGDARSSFERIAMIWSVVLKVPVSEREVALCMIGLKLCREANMPNRDNLVDICGYAALTAKLPE